ncbi:Plasmodium exported protein (PHISTa), unknown, putative [Plasmodium sp.]|nr:Plasmodium exported protein (PHISTa), unknown, putative [Plasmodium sp.]
MNIEKYFTIFPFYHADVNQKGKSRYISFKFLCISLYTIGIYYFLFKLSLENNSLEIYKCCNIYERTLGEAEKKHNGPQSKRNLKRKKEDLNKTNSKKNNTKCNEQKVEENKNSTNNDHGHSKVENNSNSSVNNINYNDMSKNLTEKELLDVLNSLEECPSKEDLRNIWTHTIGVAKEGVDVIFKELKALIQKYLDNDFREVITMSGQKEFTYDYIWKGHNLRLFQSVTSEEVEHTHQFYRLINDEHSLDNILKFIYSFLEYFKKLKMELHEKHKKELLQDIEQARYLREHRNINLKKVFS